MASPSTDLVAIDLVVHHHGVVASAAPAVAVAVLVAVAGQHDVGGAAAAGRQLLRGVVHALVEEDEDVAELGVAVPVAGLGHHVVDGPGVQVLDGVGGANAELGRGLEHRDVRRLPAARVLVHVVLLLNWQALQKKGIYSYDQIIANGDICSWQLVRKRYVCNTLNNNMHLYVHVLELVPCSFKLGSSDKKNNSKCNSNMSLFMLTCYCTSVNRD